MYFRSTTTLISLRNNIHAIFLTSITFGSFIQYAHIHTNTHLLPHILNKGASREWRREISLESISLFNKMEFMQAQQLKMLYSQSDTTEPSGHTSQHGRRTSIIGACIFLELDRFRAARINDQGTGDLSSMLCPDQLSYHIASWFNIKFQCQWNNNTSLWNC